MTNLQSCRVSYTSSFSDVLSRIVITSSGAAIIAKLGEGTTTFNETNWGDESVRIVEEQGVDAPKMVKYRASKTLAEKGMIFLQFGTDLFLSDLTYT